MQNMDRVRGIMLGLALGVSGALLQAQSTPAALQAAPAGAKTHTGKIAGKGPMPTGAKGVCRDGTYAIGGERNTACKGHKGVRTWFSDGN